MENPLTTDDPVLAQLVSLWTHRRAGGVEASPADLCRDHPELEPELRRRIDALRHVDQLAVALSIHTGSYEHVEHSCQEFTGEWDGGSRPDLSSYLNRVAAEGQPTLLRNLLHQEIQQRRQRGEVPSAQEYAARFPQHASLIRQVFLEVSTFSFPADSSAPRFQGAKVPVANRLGEYCLLRELGRGGMGVVFEAVHLQGGHRVALKTLPIVDGDALHRFKREFRSLADVSHPNLIGLHALAADGVQWFFTMDLLAGVDFLSHVRPDDRLDEGRLRSALTQLAAGVMALHARHMVHRDLKPSNVMVTEQGQVVLLDFGLIAELGRAGASGSEGKIAGTPAYMAPEQAAGQRVGPLADWYAVGVMLYEALAGQTPFRGSLYKLLMDKQRLDAPPLPDDGSIPADLAQLCHRLLAREPADRPNALQIAGFVSAQAKVEIVSPSGEEVRLVGREQHLAELQTAYRTVKERQEPLTVLISGRSGEGKSSLAEHFLAPMRGNPGVAIMSGRCYDRESVPFKALDSLIDDLTSFLRALPDEEAALLMPDDIGALCRVFPVLQRVEVVARASDPRVAHLDEQQVRGRAFRALRSFLMRVSRRALVVWFIDDLQWGDADSAEALFEVLRPPEPPPLLLLGTYRSDETEGSAFLAMWKELQHKQGVSFADREVKVGPLTVEECTQLVVNLLGKDNEVVRRRAAEFAGETRGNPFLLIELVGCFDADADSFEPIPLHEALARKLERLPAEAGNLLEVVAVSGQALSLEEASRTAGHEILPVATLTRMRNERLLRQIGAEDRLVVDTYHDRVREAVLGQLEEGRCKTLHRSLAEVVEKGSGVSAEQMSAVEAGEQSSSEAMQPIPRVYDLAYHFDAAGEKRKAWIYALLAAEQARRQSALEVAVNNYTIAKRNAAETSNGVRYRIAEGYGEAQMLLGRYEEAAEQLHGAVDLVEDAERKARIDALLGEIAFKQGAMDRSIASYEQGLRRLGQWAPQTPLGFGYGVLREAVVQCWHSLRPGRLHRKPSGSRFDLIIRLLVRLSYSYGFQNTLKTVWSHLAGMNCAELPPPSARLAYSYAFHGMVMAMLGWQGRGSRFGERSVALACDFDDCLGQGISCNYTGIGLYVSACYEEAAARLSEAIAAFEKAGDLWEVNLAHFHKGCCHFGLGNLAEAVAEARWTFESSARLGDSRTLCSSYLWARAARGNISFEELKSCYPSRPDDVMSTVHGIMAEGHWHTFHGRTEEALRTFERAGQIVWKTMCVNSHTIVVLPELAAALRRHAETVQSKNPQLCAQLRRRAYRLAKWSTRLTRLFPAAYPQALLERAQILSDYGKTKKALRYAEKSCALAESQKAKYQYAQSLLVRGKLAKQLGLPQADEQIRGAEAQLDALERTVQATANALQQPRA